VRTAIHEVKLRPGDAVVWKDERVLHGRNAFRATEASERFLWKCAVDVGVFD
jgi:alpha-ketoglutarate-dependent taurine dioxygenase